MSLLCLLISSAQATPFPGFSNAASGDLANNVTHCAVTADFNGDGLPDIFRGAENDRLFRNDGGGNFTDVTSNSGITGQTQDTSFAIAADFDNDGDLDLLVGGGLFSFRPVQLYQNNGSGVFTDVTAAKGLTQVAGVTGVVNRSAAFADFDKDGDLDLVLIISGRENVLFRNNGAPNFTFTDITSAAGFNEPAGLLQSNDLTVGDFDADGDLDIFVAGKFSLTTGATPNQLWRNNGNGTFTDVASTLGIAQTPQNAQSCCSGDIDNDGDIDLVVGAPGAIAIFRNSGRSFTDVASAAEVTVSGTVVSCQLSDLDFDGKLDLLLGLQSGGGSNELQILRNTTNGTISFTDVTSSLGTQTNNVQGLCVADFDNDNDLDIFAGTAAATTDNLLLLSNGQNLGNFIKLVLKATISNRSTIGTRIVSTFNPITIRDVISGGRSQNDLTPFIGLGSATSVTISVLWPNGITSSFENLAANQTIGALETQSVPIPSRVPVGKTRRLLLVGEGFADFNQFFINGIAVTDRKIINKTLGTDAVVGVSFTAPAINLAGIFDITARISGTNTTFIIAQEAIRYVGQKTVTTRISGGTEQSNYIMLGIPVSDDDSNALETSFFNQLGIGDRSKARAFSFDGTAYEEILTIGDNKDDVTDEGGTEGKAIWVISSSTVNLALTGGDTSEGAVNGISDPPVAVILHTGFNQVSPGFVGNFDPNNAVVTNGETFIGVTSTNNTFTSKSFLEFTGNLASPYQIATSLDGQTGYWIANLTNQSLVLFFGNPTGANRGAAGVPQAHNPALRSFLRMDASQSSLPRSIKRSLTGNSQGIRRASDSSTTPPPPPGGITNAASSSGGSGGGCFIATAAYGSKLDPRLDPLRTFRDRSLLAAPVGNAFTKTYYANSPTAANALRTSKTARALVRKWLKPAVEGIGK